MKLTASNVDKVIVDCLYKKGEDTSNHIVAHGVMNHIGFHPDRLEHNRENIHSMLRQLPDSFGEHKGGDHFTKACNDITDNLWGQHPDIDHLLCLGLAVGLVKFLLPRELWVATLGVPYFCVVDKLTYPVPKVNDEVYIPSSLHVYRGADDVMGGKAIIDSVHYSDTLPPDHFNYVMIGIKGFPNTRHNWKVLLEKHEELKERFGDQEAKADPDNRPEFNKEDADWK